MLSLSLREFLDFYGFEIREKRRGQKQITDPVLLRKIILFLADNIGSSVSIASIGNALANEWLLDD